MRSQLKSTPYVHPSESTASSDRPDMSICHPGSTHSQPYRHSKHVRSIVRPLEGSCLLKMPPTPSLAGTRRFH